MPSMHPLKDEVRWPLGWRSAYCNLWRSRFSLFATLVVVMTTFLLGVAPQAAVDQRCVKALDLLAAQGFQKDSTAYLENGICAVDIANYAALVEFVLARDGGAETQEIEARLLKAADSGNFSAKIIYTLVFTNIVNSKFAPEFASERSYSRYISYIDGVSLLAPWRPAQGSESLNLSNILIDEALSQDVLEAYLFKYAFSVLYYKRDNDSAFREDAATSLLTFARFFGNIDVARDHLSKLFSLSDIQLDSLEARVSGTVDRILARSEVARCAQSIDCVADSNLRQLVCQLRERSGQALLNISEEDCTRLVRPLVDLYRRRIEKMFVEVLSATKR